MTDEPKPIGAAFDDAGLEYQYMPDQEFQTFVRSLPWSRKSLVSIREKMRWVITDDNGKQYVLRPESARPETEPQ